MSNLDPEKDYSNMTDAFKFILNQFKKSLYSVIPGVIESYDQSSKRCRVKPAINIKKTDGTVEEQTEVVNVPVVWPSGGGFTILSPLPEGTPVLIFFSQRGITKFKETFETEDPGKGVFAKEDAIVIPSFGGLSVSPATANGICMQTEDGSNFIFVEDGDIEITATSKVTVNAPDIEANADTITANATDIIANATTSVTITSPLTTINGNLTLTGNLVMPTGLISGTNVFGGASGETHGHTQGVDNAGDTQQKTNGPS